MTGKRVGRKGSLRVCLLLILAGLSSCSKQSPDTDPATVASPQVAGSEAAEPDPPVSPTPSDDPVASARALGANELGVVPVLMYHRIHREAAGEYDRTPAEFRAELKRLWREGYVPVRTVDLADANPDVPAGKSPVVLTFDDSSAEQFGYTKKGDIDPNTAIGILLDFAAEHEGFRATASLYVNQRPFNSSDYPKMLRDLHERGFELGNHTLEHLDLGSSSPSEAKRQLALGRNLITDAVPEAEVATVSLPLGISPHPKRLAWSGRWRGIHYDHRGVLLVGSNPAPSPFDRSFDPHAIPRIRSAEQRGSAPTYGSEYWLDHLRKNAQERFVSDGDPGTVAFPRTLGSRLAHPYRSRALPY